MSSFIQNTYYFIKPLVPRWMQIQLRRSIVLRKRLKYAQTWPIDERAKNPPEGWQGWPDNKRFALVLTHDVETAKGLEKCHPLSELEKNLGFRSSFNFVAEDYTIPSGLKGYLTDNGFEIGLHGLSHGKSPFKSEEVFQQQVTRVNHYLKEWGCVGFRAPSMYHNLELAHNLNILYDSSTFDTDPFEPQPDGVGTIFPFWVAGNSNQKGYVELPYTLPQDFTLFVIMKERNIDIWKQKLDWVAEHGGMALLIAHPDYMCFEKKKPNTEEYPAEYYRHFLEYIKTSYGNQYWNVLPKNLADFWESNYRKKDIKSREDFSEDFHEYNRKGYLSKMNKKKIWIDLDNSPHVPLFDPIIKELEKLNYQVVLTARDCSQTCGLADLYKLNYKRIGRHYGKHKIAKLAGLLVRSMELSPEVVREKPAIALSHGSRSQHLLAFMLGIPTIIMLDYEHVKMLPFFRSTWIIMPEAIPTNAIKFDKNHVIQYPGIKEDVYVPNFIPNPEIKKELGLNTGDLIATIRPPATEAHYHNPESEELFAAAINFLGNIQKVRMVLLPRNDQQMSFITDTWADWCSNRKIIIPDHVIDGLNLLWYSDFVISGGGTMNREAAALGVPVYSIFRGKIGAVDRYLSDTGRLTLLTTVEEVRTKIIVAPHDRPGKPEHINNAVLKSIVEGIIEVIEKTEKRNPR